MKWIIGIAIALFAFGGINTGPDGAINLDPTLGSRVQVQGVGPAVGGEAGGALGAAVDGAVGEISPGAAAKITGVAAGGYAAGQVSRYAGQAAVDRLRRGIRVPTADNPAPAPPITAPQQPRPPSPPPAVANAGVEATAGLAPDDSSTAARVITGVAGIAGFIGGAPVPPQQRVAAGEAVVGAGIAAVEGSDWSQANPGAAAGAAGGLAVPPPWLLVP